MTDMEKRLDKIDQYAAEVEAEARALEYENLISHHVTNAVNWFHCLNEKEDLEARVKELEQVIQRLQGPTAGLVKRDKSQT